MFGDQEGEICRNNVIRRNTFIKQRVFTDGGNGSMVVLAGSPVGSVEGNRIEGNQLLGSEGLGIVVFGDTHDNLIRKNEFNMLGGTATPIPCLRNLPRRSGPR